VVGAVIDSVEVDGLLVAYERVGSGPAVVLLHGYVGDGPATWRAQLDGLADSFTVVAWDAPGAGRSADPPESFGMRGYADCLAGFIAELGLPHPTVVGLSFGGALAIACGARHRGIARALVVVSGYAGWAGSLTAGAAEQRLSQAIALSGRSPTELADTLLPTMFAVAPEAVMLDRFVASMRGFHPIGFRAMARASAEDLRGALPRIDVPTLLVCGDRDERAPRAVADDLHASIMDSRLVVLPGRGHVCNLEAPEEFNHVLRAWLEDHR
jgi:pimeloyl-ACP methyl ester carboxylesterase